MTKPNNFGSIYEEFSSDGAISYEVYSKDTGITYFQGFNDKLDLEGVRRMIRGCIHELTQLNSKGEPYSRVKDKNTKKKAWFKRLLFGNSNNSFAAQPYFNLSLPVEGSLYAEFISA